MSDQHLHGYSFKRFLLIPQPGREVGGHSSGSENGR